VGQAQAETFHYCQDPEHSDLLTQPAIPGHRGWQVFCHWVEKTILPKSSFPIKNNSFAGKTVFPIHSQKIIIIQSKLFYNY